MVTSVDAKGKTASTLSPEQKVEQQRFDHFLRGLDEIIEGPTVPEMKIRFCQRYGLLPSYNGVPTCNNVEYINSLSPPPKIEKDILDEILEGPRISDLDKHESSSPGRPIEAIIYKQLKDISQEHSLFISSLLKDLFGIHYTFDPQNSAHWDELDRQISCSADRAIAQLKKNAKDWIEVIVALPPDHNAVGEDVEKHREETLNFAQKIIKAKLASLDELAREMHTKKVQSFLTRLGLASPSIATLTLVHLLLWGLSIKLLGGKRHTHLLEPTINGDFFGCLAMTELGHGSNILGLETTATYDPTTQEFVFDSPTETSKKIWSGGAAKNASRAIIFARLIIKGVDHGVHAFWADIRKDGKVLPGLEIGDMGHKAGLNGVDNGWIKFKGFRVPRENLLDKYIDVLHDGTLINKGKKKPQKYIYDLLAQFVAGRKTIAVNSGDGFEFLMMVLLAYPPMNMSNYQLEQKVASLMSEIHAYESIKEIYLGNHPKNHYIASLMKSVLSSKLMSRFMELEALYGNSPHTSRILHVLKTYRLGVDPTLTYEGDNTLLLMLGSKFGIKRFLSFVIVWLKWIIRGDLRAVTEPINLFFSNDLLYQFQRKVLRKSIVIAYKLFWSKNPMQLIDSKLSPVLQQLARQFAEVVILEKLRAKTATMGEFGNALYKVYACEVAGRSFPGFYSPDLSEEKKQIAFEIPSMIKEKNFGEWMKALIPPPPQSLPHKAFGITPVKTTIIPPEIKPRPLARL